MKNLNVHAPFIVLVSKRLADYRNSVSSDDFYSLKGRLQKISNRLKFLLGWTAAISVMALLTCVVFSCATFYVSAIFASVLLLLFLLQSYASLAHGLMGSATDFSVAAQLLELAQQCPKTLKYLQSVVDEHVCIRALDYLVAASSAKALPRWSPSSYQVQLQAGQVLMDMCVG